MEKRLIQLFMIFSFILMLAGPAAALKLEATNSTDGTYELYVSDGSGRHECQFILGPNKDDWRDAIFGIDAKLVWVKKVESTNLGGMTIVNGTKFIVCEWRWSGPNDPLSKSPFYKVEIKSGEIYIYNTAGSTSGYWRVLKFCPIP